MNMLKRSLAMVLALCMLFSVVPAIAFAEENPDLTDTVVSAADDFGSDTDTAETGDDAVLSYNAGDNAPADEPVVDEPVVDEPVVDEPVVDEPVVDEPVVDEPVVDEPVADEPVVDEPVADEPVVDEPVADEPVVDEPVADEPTVDELKTEQPDQEQFVEELVNIALDEDAVTQIDNATVQYRILHLDCGRKYFTKDWIIALINEMAAAGYNQLQLAFGNDGLRFLLDDMSVTVNGTTYSSENVVAGIQQGNKNYYDAGDKNELTQEEMDSIIAYANNKGIAIVPHMNMPGHMDAVLDAIEYVGIKDAHFTGKYISDRSLNLNNEEAVAFTKALLQKYVDYFAAKGCKFFHIGADEYGNDAYGENNMGFPNMGQDLYKMFADFVNACAAIVKNGNMTPRAWNDGISYRGYESNFDTDIQVTYWSAGWGGYNVETAETLQGNGHAMINTHGDYYFILTANGITNPGDTALNFNNTVFAGSSISNPVGSMFCIWCDVPGSATEQQVAEAARITLRKMAAAMQNSTSYSEAVVPGGFNENGSIAETREWLTVTDPETDVSVSGYELTAVNVSDAEAPAIEGASNVKAWDITPSVNGTDYTERGTVKLPVPSEWDTTLVRGFYLENDEAVVVTGTYDNGYYTFDMPHFSVGGIMLLDASTQFDQEIELNVGDTHEIVIENVNYNGEYGTNPTGVATVVARHEEGEGNLTVTPVSTLTVGNTYYIINSQGKYMSAAPNWVDSADDAVAWTAAQYPTYDDYYFAYNGKYLAYNPESNYWFTTEEIDNNYIEFIGYSEWSQAWEGYMSGESFTFAEVSGSEAVNQSTITFTGIAPGTTYSTVGDTTYKIVVHGSVNITIKYQTEDGTIVKTEIVSVVDNATSYTVSNFTDENGKYYVVDNTTLTITPATVTEYTVTVTETEEDLTTVTPLTIEYWQTNARAEEQRGSNIISKTVTAESAYSESGIDLSTIIPMTTYKEDSAEGDPALVYWRSRLLNRATNEQTSANGDDETLNGVGFTKVRYWNGSWAVYNEAGEWQNVTLAEYQLVAYYMNDMNLADEVSVSTSDWGKKGNGEFAGAYLDSNNVSLAFQIVYDDGTTSPIDTTAASLAPYTYLVNHWGNRGVGTVAINQIGDYKIWKVTAETGEHSATHNGTYNPITLNSFTWDNNEMVVWEDENNPVSQYTILNPANNPNAEGYYDNLRWNENYESILIRIYLATEETEDSLKVVYYDEKFGATLAEFPISVPNGSNFSNGIVEANTKTTATLPVFTDNADRKDATGYGIVNALGKTQNFETTLANVAVTNNRYNPELYKYTGSVVSEDGKTITHYYTIDQTALSPNFVADFGLPLTFKLSDVVKEGITTVQSVTVTPTTKFGTLTYTADARTSDGTFTYTPTKILTTIDVLTISILFDGQPTATTTNVGVTPATTVYYEESFVNWDSSWTGGATKPIMTQNTAVLGEDTNNYGYDLAYANTTGASNGTNASTTTMSAKGTFTFTGNGIQVFANATESSGYVSVEVKNSSGKIVNLSMVDTVVEEGATDATTGQAGNLNGLPVVSLIDLENIPHDTYTVTITKVMDTEPVYIDGIRVFNTVEDSTIFVSDLEDNPDFYELRDAVLHAIGVGKDTSVDYTTMYEQVYNDVADADALITDETVTYGDSETIRDLLDKGPKNEIFLYSGQTLTFKVTTNRVMQVGLKAPNGTVAATILVDGADRSQDITSSVDMFYTLADKADSETTHTVQITNSGSNILSVTELKICDDPNASFVPFTADEIKDILGGDEEGEAPAVPEVPTEPSKPVEPTEPEAPSEPEVEETKPSKPEKPEKPSKPEKPGKPDKEESKKDAKLNITFVNLFGKKVGSATLTKTGTANERCVFSASEISAQAPAGKYVMRFFPAVVSYGKSASIIVPVI